MLTLSDYRCIINRRSKGEVSVALINVLVLIIIAPDTSYLYLIWSML